MRWRKVQLSTKYVKNAIEVMSKMLERGLGGTGTTGVLLWQCLVKYSALCCVR